MRRIWALPLPGCDSNQELGVQQAIDGCVVRAVDVIQMELDENGVPARLTLRPRPNTVEDDRPRHRRVKRRRRKVGLTARCNEGPSQSHDVGGAADSNTAITSGGDPPAQAEEGAR